MSWRRTSRPWWQRSMRTRRPRRARRQRPTPPVRCTEEWSEIHQRRDGTSPRKDQCGWRHRRAEFDLMEPRFAEPRSVIRLTPRGAGLALEEHERVEDARPGMVQCSIVVEHEVADDEDSAGLQRLLR